MFILLMVARQYDIIVDMIVEYYALGPPAMKSIIKCDDCGEIRITRRNKHLLKKENHPCRSCSNKRNGIKKKGKPSWNSGKRYSLREVERTSYINSSGYVEIWCGRGEGSRGRKDGYRLQHHLVIEDTLGRKIQKNEVVHHINGNKTDNRIENLWIFKSISEHRQSHASLENIAMQLVSEGVILFENGRYLSNESTTAWNKHRN